MTRVENKRRRSSINFAIKRQFQFRLIFSIMLIVFLAVAVSGVLFYVYSSQEVGQSFKQFHINARSFLDLLLPAVVGSLILGIIAAFAASVFFPHRIAGPLHRMEKEIKERVAQGDLSHRFTIRKGDELVEVADALNVMVDKLRERMLRIRDSSEALSLLTQDMDRGDDESLKKIAEVAKGIADASRGFKL